MTLKFVDLFGVPGGMSLGFSLADMKPVGALDKMKPGIETYKKNFPKVREENVVCDDASSNNVVEKFMKNTSLKKGDVDIIIGGPPCQGFSAVGRIKIASLVKNGQRNGRSSNARFIDDKRNHLYKSFIRFVDKFKPKAVVMENVLGMVSYKDGDVVRQIKEDFKNVGYNNVKSEVLNAVDYGVPQSRKRIFFIATKNNAEITFSQKTHFPKSEFDRKLLSPNSKDYATIWDAIGDLPLLKLPEKNSKQKNSIRKYKSSPSCEYQKWARGKLNENNSYVTKWHRKKDAEDFGKVENNITRWHRPKDIEVFGHMSPGSKWSDLSKKDRKKIGYSDDSFKDKWKRLPMNTYSWTVTSHLHKDGYMFIHPKQNRTISVREAARLQSFPDSFVFCGSRSAQFKQIGNAVPPLLAYAIAKHVKKLISK